VDVWTGKRGGPIADLAQLFGDIVAVESLPVRFEVDGGQGMLRIGAVLNAQMAPYTGPDGQVTTLNESIFSTIPGSPAYVAKATTYERQTAQYGLDNISLENHNAIQGYFRFQA
jgi:hypothetical protein